MANASKERSEEEVHQTLIEMNRVLRWLSSKIHECHSARCAPQNHNIWELSIREVGALLEKEEEYRQTLKRLSNSWSNCCARLGIAIPTDWQTWAT